MIGFLLPKLAWFALLALVPLALHLLNRIRLRRVEFSSLQFLRDVRREKFNWLRLRELVLLILRTALLLLLFLGLSRPFLRRGLVGARHEASAVIILDNTLSMTGSGSFERARASARTYLAQMSASSEVALLTATDVAVPYLSRDHGSVLAGLDSLDPGFRADDLAAALEAAAGLLDNATLPRREIVIFTDLQRRALPLSAAPPRFPTLVRDCGAGTWRNCAVVSVALRDLVPLPGKPVSLSVRIRNFGPVDETRVVALRLGPVQEERTIRLPAGEERHVDFDLGLTQPQSDTGLVCLDPDPLPADDRRYFVMPEPGRIPVLIVGELPEDTVYLARALAPESTGLFAVTTRLGAGLRTAELRRYRTIVLVNPQALSQFDWQRLDDYIRQGGAILCLLGRGPVTGPVLSRVLSGASDMRPSGFVTIEHADYGHPILGAFRTRSDVSLPRFFRYTRLDAGPARILARFSDGNPFLLESRSQRIILMACDVRPLSTDLPVRALFVPLLHRITGYLAQTDEPREYLVGDTVLVRAPAIGALRVRSPDSEFLLTGTPEQGTTQEVRFAATELPGFYRFDDRPYAVNVRTEEGDLTRLTDAELARNGLTLMGSDRPQARDLTGSLLLAAALCLIAEMFVLII